MTRTYKTESAWMQGANACANGVPRSGNPYRDNYDRSPESLDHEGWDNGWYFKKHRLSIERLGRCTRRLSDGRECGLVAPCPDCGPAVHDVPQGA
jgi:hypothetical protein